MDVRCFSASSLLHDKYRRTLRNEGLLRPPANGGDVLWQQMTLENFEKLLRDRSLYFRAYGEYTDYDEMRLHDFIEPHIRGYEKAPDVDRLREVYDIFEKKLFISCWFNSLDLADVSFKVYTKNSIGVAIGTSVDALIRQMSQAGDDYNKDCNHNNKIHSIACANIQYVPQNFLRDEELFEPAQVYAPIFTKGGQFRMDHEFRVCLEMKEPDMLSYNSAQNQRVRNEWLSRVAQRVKDADAGATETFSVAEEELKENNQMLAHIFEPTNHRLPVNPDELVKYIAIKDDGLFHELGAQVTSELFERTLHVSMVLKQNINGFMVFKLQDKLGGAADV